MRCCQHDRHLLVAALLKRMPPGEELEIDLIGSANIPYYDIHKKIPRGPDKSDSDECDSDERGFDSD